MDFALDARIAHYNTSGISRYVRGLLKGLERSERDFTCTVYQSWRMQTPLTTDPRFRTKSLLTPSHFAAEGTSLKFELRAAPRVPLQALDFFTPVPDQIPQICTIYDLYFLRDPSCMDRRSFAHYVKLKRYAPTAIACVCISEATRNDAIELLGVSPSRLPVIYPGFEPTPNATSEECKQTATQFALDPGFILTVGTIEPRKNLRTLFAAYKRTCELLGSEFPRLVLAGRLGYQGKEILAEIDRLGLANKVQYLGEVTERQLSSLYSLSGMVAYPSLYEGFGFPLLEAMAAGSPVVTANVSSLPEVAGNAAHYVEPNDVVSISEALLSVHRDREFAAELVRRGADQVKKFTWDRAAAKMLELYDQPKHTEQLRQGAR